MYTVSCHLPFYAKANTRGKKTTNSLIIFHYDLREHFFSAFKAKLDKFGCTKQLNAMCRFI